MLVSLAELSQYCPPPQKKHREEIKNKYLKANKTMSNLQESNIMQGIVEAFKAASPEEQRTMILAISGIAAFGMLLNYLKSLIK